MLPSCEGTSSTSHNRGRIGLLQLEDGSYAVEATEAFWNDLVSITVAVCGVDLSISGPRHLHQPLFVMLQCCSSLTPTKLINSHVSSVTQGKYSSFIPLIICEAIPVYTKIQPPNQAHKRDHTLRAPSQRKATSHSQHVC